MKTKPTKETIIRTACLLLTMINALLALFNKSPLPFGSEQITEVVSFILMAISALVAWWKNNSFTISAIKADEQLAIEKSK